MDFQATILLRGYFVSHLKSYAIANEYEVRPSVVTDNL